MSPCLTQLSAGLENPGLFWMYDTTSSSNIFHFLFTDKRHFSMSKKTKSILQWCFDVAVWCLFASTSLRTFWLWGVVWNLDCLLSFNVTFHCNGGNDVTCGLIHTCLFSLVWCALNGFNGLDSQGSAANSDVKQHYRALLRGAFVSVLTASQKHLTEHWLGHSRV